MERDGQVRHNSDQENPLTSLIAHPEFGSSHLSRGHIHAGKTVLHMLMDSGGVEDWAGVIVLP